jgi:hypothetical protein
VPQHAAHVGQEAHVEHAVGLVEHEHLEPAQRRIGGAEVVEQPPRRRDDHVHARAEGVLLRAHSDAAEDGRARDRGVHRQLLEVLIDLRAQLARGRQDQRARGPARLRHQPLQDRQAEGGGLAAAGRRAGEHVAPLERGADRLLLDRGRAREAQLADAAQQQRVEPERREGHAAQRSVCGARVLRAGERRCWVSR